MSYDFLRPIVPASEQELASFRAKRIESARQNYVTFQRGSGNDKIDMEDIFAQMCMDLSDAGASLTALDPTGQKAPEEICLDMRVALARIFGEESPEYTTCTNFALRYGFDFSHDPETSPQCCHRLLEHIGADIAEARRSNPAAIGSSAWWTARQGPSMR